MRIKNKSPFLAITTVTSRRPPTPELSLVVKGTFDLVEGGAMTVVPGIAQAVQEGLHHDVLDPDDTERTGALERASDFAPFKPHAEVLLIGACHAPGGKSVTELPVKLRVGKLEKALLVRGEQPKGRDKPARFLSLPLDYAHAFGGADYPLNPVGVGHGDGAMPSVIDPNDTADPPRPASYAPLNPAWPQRAGRQGKQYDDDYLDNRFPYYPVDFDWRHFQAAPHDQWIEGHFRGDEKVALENLLEGGGRFEGRLSGHRVRAFVADDRGNPREVAMGLDTVTFLTEERQCVLTWRGLTEVRKALATDVTAILVVAEPIASPPGDTGAYLRELAAFEANPADMEAAFPPGAEALLADALAAGAGPDVALEVAKPPTASADDPTARLREQLERALPDALGAAKQSTIESAMKAAETEQGRAEVAATFAALDGPKERGQGPIPPYMGPSHEAQARVYVRARLEATRSKMLEARGQIERAIKSVSGPRKKMAVERLAELDASLAQLDDPQLVALDPTIRPVSDGTPAPGADLSGQDLTDRDLRGVDLTGATLDGALLVRCDLRGAKLEGASLVGAVVYGADLTGANLRGAKLGQWNAAETLLDDADLSGATIDEAQFKDASLRGTKLDGVKGRFAVFAEAELSGASVRGAELHRPDFRAARLGDADFSKSAITEGFFLEATADGVVFDDCRLDKASFLMVDLKRASFQRARGERVNFLKARLEAAKFGFAVFHDVFMDDAVAPDASFRAADLRGARLPRAELNRARFDQANLFGADLSDAEVNDASFRGANLYEAQMLRTAGASCDLTDANTKMARFGGRL